MSFPTASPKGRCSGAKALEAALSRDSWPDIINTDLSRPVHKLAFTDVLSKPTSPSEWPVRVPGPTMSSWSGLCDPSNTRRSPKVYETMIQAQVSISRYKLIYDTGTAYSSFDRNTADQSYFNRCCQSRGLNPACIPLSKPKTINRASTRNAMIFKFTQMGDVDLGQLSLHFLTPIRRKSI